MDFIRIIIVAGMVTFPALAMASDCHVVEYPDHYEAVCIGHESPVAAQGKAGATTTRNVAPQTPVVAPAPAARGSQATPGGAAAPQSDAVKSLSDYWQRESRIATRDAAKASRMRLIREGLANQAGSAPVQNTTGLKP